MSTRIFIFVLCLASISLLAFGGIGLAAPPGDTPPATLSKGAQLYDKWWKAAGVGEPKGDQPLWSTQTTNTRKGLDTWRCKECHGWDYKGKDGAYSSGSHKTGFVGVVDASKSKTQEQIAAILKGSSNPKHNFSPALDDASISALASFVKEGVGEDLTRYVDYATKKPKGGDVAHGTQLFNNVCAACHGKDGKTINFGTDKKPEYVGDVAEDNPQEFLHKVRYGQPGAPMPAGVVAGWTVKDTVDVLAYAQTLVPQKEPAAPASPVAAAKPQAAAPPVAQLPKSGEPTALVAFALVAGLVLLVAGFAIRRIWGNEFRAPQK